MSFVSQPYMASLNAAERSLRLATHTSFGWHPDTQDEFHIPHLDRCSGGYVLGVQDSGKSRLLQNLIAAVMQSGHAVIVIDPQSRDGRR